MSVAPPIVPAPAGRVAVGGTTRWLLGVVSVVMGASALVLQVTWQRVVALHAGVDSVAAATVTAAFLAGLGVGSALGGRWADDRPIRRVIRLLALVNVGLALFAAVSVPFIYGVNRAIGAAVEAPVVTFALNAVLLAVPTILAGTALPLIARSVVASTADAGPTVGRFAALNTAGAAIGAFVGTWYLVGVHGPVGVSRLAAIVHLAVAAVLFLAVRGSGEPAPGPAVDQVPGSKEVPSEHGEPVASRWWFLVVAIGGAVALGFEQMFFRLVDGVMRSNAYTFGHVLGLYLVMLAVGAWVGSRLVGRIADPRTGYLGLQFLAGLAAVGSLTLLVRGGPRSPLASTLSAWFSSEGLAFGLSTSSPWERSLFGVILPLFLLGPAVACFGASFPFAQAIVTRRRGTVGRDAGLLQAAILAGNVVGAALGGLVLLEHLGTSVSFLVLGVPPVVAGLAAARLLGPPRWIRASAAVVGVVVLAVLAVPSNRTLWSYLLGVPEQAAIVAEDGSCSAAMKLVGEQAAGLVINGRTQNGYPFDDFHLGLGLVPALVHPSPERALVIGFGAGSTSYGALASGRVASLHSVEICGGIYEMTREFADRGWPEFERLKSDPTHEQMVGDGRKRLFTTSPGALDLAIPDTLIPTSSGSNNLYSVEFFELVADRLDEDGMLAIWSATPRVAAGVTTTFPHVSRLRFGAEPNGPQFLLASRSPIEVDPAVLVARFDATAAASFDPVRRAELRELLADIEVECLNAGAVAPLPAEDLVNRDLRPRDEYFLNVAGMGEESVPRTCVEAQSGPR